MMEINLLVGNRDPGIKDYPPQRDTCSTSQVFTYFMEINHRGFK